VIERQDEIDLEKLIACTLLAGGELHDTIPSTNDLAKELPRASPLPYLVLAHEQTAGRGRGGNSWWTGHGSLAMSLVVDPAQRGITAPHVTLVSLATAVALVETVEKLFPSVSVGLHWPNDVFAAGRKLSGILIECLADGRMVIGIGVNTNNTVADAPSALRATATTLRDLTGRLCDHTEFLIELLGRLEACLERLAERPASIAQDANRLCRQHGRHLRVASGGRLVAGTCRGIADDGALLLETLTRLERIYSGVLHH